MNWENSIRILWTPPLLLKYFFLLLQCDSEGDDDKASTLILISLLKTSQLMFLNDIYESRKLIKPVFNSSTLWELEKLKQSVGNKCPCNVSGEVARSRFITRSDLPVHSD